MGSEMLPFDHAALAQQDNDGKTALQLAQENGHTTVAEILTRHLQAIIEAQTASIAEGGDQLAIHYRLRGQAWQALGDAEKAQADFDKLNAEADR